MVFNGILTLLQQTNEIASEALVAFRSKLHFITVAKNVHFLEVGQICDKLCYVNKGLVRGYYNKSGKEVTAWFASEGTLFYAGDSFLLQKPTIEIIETLENCEFVYILRDDLYELYNSYPSINSFGRILAETDKLQSQQSLLDLRMNIAKDRLISFAKNNRGLFLRVPQKHIASHIGVSEGYISELLGRVKI